MRRMFEEKAQSKRKITPLFEQNLELNIYNQWKVFPWSKKLTILCNQLIFCDAFDTDAPMFCEECCKDIWNIIFILFGFG